MAIGSELEGCEQMERGVVEVDGDEEKIEDREVRNEKEVRLLEKSVSILSL